MPFLERLALTDDEIATLASGLPLARPVTRRPAPAPLQFHNLERWLGIPWVMNGEQLTGADCWGLCKLVYARELGLELVHASESTTAAAAESARRLKTVKQLILGEVRFRPVLDEVPWLDFDIVEIALGGGEADHVAIVAGGMLLHSRAGIGSHRAPIARFEDRIRGAWRYIPKRLAEPERGAGND